jgi:hypothetical protein
MQERVSPRSRSPRSSICRRAFIASRRSQKAISARAHPAIHRIGAGSEAAVTDRSSGHDEVVIFFSGLLPHGKALPLTRAPANGGCDVSDLGSLALSSVQSWLDDHHMIR